MTTAVRIGRPPTFTTGDPCGCCGRPLRPAGEEIEDHVPHRAGGICASCYRAGLRRTGRPPQPTRERRGVHHDPDRDTWPRRP